MDRDTKRQHIKMMYEVYTTPTMVDPGGHDKYGAPNKPVVIKPEKIQLNIDKLDSYDDEKLDRIYTFLWNLL